MPILSSLQGFFVNDSLTGIGFYVFDDGSCQSKNRFIVIDLQYFLNIKCLWV